MAEKNYQCDLCDHIPFKAPTALGRHKRAAHNIPGKSHSAISYRRAKAKHENEVEPDDERPGSVMCRNCKPAREFKSLLGLKIHQAHAHNIPGAKSTALAKNTSTALTLTHHAEMKSHATGSNGHGQSIAHNEPPLSGEDLLVFQTVGEIKGHCRSVAESAGFPTPQFTARVIHTLYSQTRR